MAVPYRPLGLVKEMLEQLGVTVAYAYEDLVFMENNGFLLQFGRQGEVLFFAANAEGTVQEEQRWLAVLQPLASARGIRLIRRSAYRLTAGDDDQLTLVFVDDPATA